MKMDARVRYTRGVLRSALFGCLRDKPLREVTVKEVCEAAGVSRATFYAHYRDCYDLLEQIEGDMLEACRTSLLRIDAMNAGAVTAAILDAMEANRDLCELLIHHRPDDALPRKMVELAHELCIDRWKQTLRRAAPEEVERIFSCLAAGLLHVILSEFGKCDRETLVAFASATVRSCVSPYV